MIVDNNINIIMDEHTMSNKSPNYYAGEISRRQFLQTSMTVGGLVSVAPCTAMASSFTYPLPQNPIARNPLKFNGERRDPITGTYHLGNGSRMYNPSLIRFHACDNMSPFGKGGINSYAYCLGDPINKRDPSGHFAILSLFIGAIVGAVIGFVTSAVSQGISSAITGNEFDWKQVGIGTALGFISGGFGAAAQGVKFPVQLGLAVANTSATTATQFGLNIAAGTPVKQAAIGAGVGVLLQMGTFSFGAVASALYRNSGASYLITAAGHVKFSKAGLPMIYNKKAWTSALTVSSSITSVLSSSGTDLSDVSYTDSTSNNRGRLNNNGALSLKATHSSDDQSMLNTIHKVSADPRANIVEGIISMGGPIGSPVAFKSSQNNRL